MSRTRLPQAFRPWHYGTQITRFRLSCTSLFLTSPIGLGDPKIRCEFRTNCGNPQSQKSLQMTCFVAEPRSESQLSEHCGTSGKLFPPREPQSLHLYGNSSSCSTFLGGRGVRVMVSSVLQREFKNSDKGHCLSAASCLLSEFWGLLRVDRAATPLLWGRGGCSEQLALILRLEGKPQACRLSPLQLQAAGAGGSGSKRTGSRWAASMS